MPLREVLDHIGMVAALIFQVVAFVEWWRNGVSARAAFFLACAALAGP